MNNHFKSALSQIKAEGSLKIKTEKYLRTALYEEKNEKTLSFTKEGGIFMKKYIIAASILGLACVGSIGGYSYYKTPVNYISLDINPSIELGVNAFDKVVSVEGYNADGKTVLEGQNIINSGVKEAVSTLVKSASDNGFIADDGSTIVAVTAETDNATKATNLDNIASQGVDEAIKAKGKTAVVYTDNVALARREEAKKLDITPGKLNLIQKLQALDPTITVDQYKNAKVKDIMKKVVELSKEQQKLQGAEDKNTNTTIKDGTEKTDIFNEKIENAVNKSMEGNQKNDKKNSDKIYNKQEPAKPVTPTTPAKPVNPVIPAKPATIEDGAGKSDDKTVHDSSVKKVEVENGSDNSNKGKDDEE